MTTPVILGLPGAHLTESDEERLTRMQPAGIILFARNYQNPEQMKQLLTNIKTVLSEDTIICVDHEGGRVVRFPEALPELPAPRVLGEGKDPEQVRKLARLSAEALSEWGVNLNLAPVVDLFLPHSHPRMRERCFGSDPHLVAEMGLAFMQGMHEGGLQSTAKHFPGIGPAREDTHEQGTVVDLTREELEILWLPFRKLIAAGVPYVMTTHATYPHIDGSRPATLSPEVMRILRKELKFQGKVISDDLEMGAIAKGYSAQEAVAQARQAGCDLASICENIAWQEEAWNYLRLAKT